jgi:hypothetical protein
VWGWFGLVVVYRAAGWVVSALAVWATWTHRISGISGWLLSTVIVASLILLDGLSLLGAPDIVVGFLYPVPIGLLAAAVVAAATAQWLPAVCLGVGGLLVLYARAASKGISDCLKTKPPQVGP